MKQKQMINLNEVEVINFHVKAFFHVKKAQNVYTDNQEDYF